MSEKLAPGVRGCAQNPVRDLAALVVLVERGSLEALSDAGSAGGRDGLALYCYFSYFI